MSSQHRRRAGIGIVALNRRKRALVIVAAISALVYVGAAAFGISLALFTAQPQGEALFGAQALFLGERATPAFQIGDSSSGAEIDRSSPFAFPADGVTTTTSPWSTAFAADRYVEFDLNDSLASGVALSAAAFDFRYSSDGAGAACHYFEVRRISTGAVLATYGSSGSPVGCVTGATLTTFSTPMSSPATTSIANDLRIRVFGRESGNGSMVIDLATVGGSTAYQAFTLFPVMLRDAADTTPEIIPWELLVP